MADIDKKEKKSWDDASYWHALYDTYKRSKELPKLICRALNVLRSDEFYDREKFKWARKTINQALTLNAVSFHPALRYQIDGQIFETAYSAERFSDLEKAVTDDNANLFGTLYDSHVIPKIAANKPEIIGISILNYQQIIPGLTLSHRLKRNGWPVFIGGTVFVKFLKEISEQIEFFSFCHGVVL